MKYAPENKPTSAAEEWKVAEDLIMTDEAKANGVGYMDPEEGSNNLRHYHLSV